MRSLDAEELAIAAQKTYQLGYNIPKPVYGYGDYYYGPSVDGKTIKGLPDVEFAERRFAAVSVVNVVSSPSDLLQVPTLASRDRYEGVLI